MNTQSKRPSRMLFYPSGMRWLRWHGKMALAEQAQIKADAGCKFCGREPVCSECGRCYDPNCNAGCIWCRRFTPPPETCACCGQTIGR